MTKINAKIVADSVNPYGQRITTYLLTYPRIIHAELLSHRMFSRNGASSRAIPFKTLIENVEKNPFIPIAWQKDHKGMQGTKYITDNVDIDNCIQTWLIGRDCAVEHATTLNRTDLAVTKQLCNRLLEPYQWYTCLVTATEYDNFFNLRCPVYKTEYGIFRSWNDLCDAERDMEFNNDTHKYYYGEGEVDPLVKLKQNKGEAEIHIMELAECMWDAMNMSTPKKLQVGEWHIPFEDKMDVGLLYNNFGITVNEAKIKIATSMAARTSYTTVGNEKEFTYQSHIDLHDRILNSGHWSPFEHCAKVPTEQEYLSSYKGVLLSINNGLSALSPAPEGFGWFDNFHGFIPYRFILEHDINI